MTRLERLKKLGELEPKDPLAHYGLGLEYSKLQQWDRAIAAFDDAIAANKKYAMAFYHKARAELGAGRTADARQTVTAGIKSARSAADRHTERELRELREKLP